MGRRVMKVAVSAAVAASIAAGPAEASHGGAPGGHDFVAGSAKNQLAEVTPFPVELRLAAHAFDRDLPTLEGLFGTSDVSGYVVGSGVFPNGEFQTQGHVTCIRVVGNRATIKYRFERTNGAGAPPPGWGVQVFVEDNGPPSGGDPDRNATDLPLPPEVFDPQADVCELPRGPYNPVDSGNYVVHDGD